MKKLLLALVSGLFLLGSSLAMAAGSGGQASSTPAVPGGQALAQKSNSSITAHAEDKLAKQVAQEKAKADLKPQKQ